MYPLISVIIPIYNVEPYLRQCVDSVINQTYTNLEIILIDDGSPDNCPAICDDYASKDNRIIVIHKKNGGLSDARNVGLDICKGDFIYFLDSDDFIGNETINDLYKAIHDDSQIAISIGYFTAVHNDRDYKVFHPRWIFSEPQVIQPEEFAFKMLSEQSNFAATAKLYRSTLLRNIRFQLNKKNEDTLFTVDIIPEIENQKFRCIDVPNYTYYYRQHSGSICHDSEDPIEWHSIKNIDSIIKTFSYREDLVNLLKKRQYELSIFLQSKLIKKNSTPLFHKNQNFIKKIPNFFILKNNKFFYFIYFILLKYTPTLLKLLTQHKIFFCK